MIPFPDFAGVASQVAQPIQGRAPEIASLSGLLDAIAERRQRLAMQQAQQAQQERHFQASQLEHQIDNARADRQMQQTADLQREQMHEVQRRQDEQDAERRRFEAAKRLETVPKELQDTGQTPEAIQALSSKLAGHGIDFGPVAPKMPVPELPDVNQAVQFRPREALPEGVPENPKDDFIPFQAKVRQEVEDRNVKAGIAELSDIEDYEAAQKAHDEAIAANQANAGKYQATLPGGARMLFDIGAEDAAKKARIAQDVTDFTKEYGPLAKEHGAFGQDAFNTAIADLRGGIKDRATAGEVFRSTLKDDMDRASREKNAALGRAARGGAKPITPDQAADNARADTAAFDAAVTRWEKGNNVDKLTDDYTKFQGMMGKVGAYGRDKDVVSQRAALYEAARYITGPGVLTESEYNNTVQRTAGWSANLLSKLQKGVSGEISDAEWHAIEKFVGNANGAIKQRALKAINNFDTRFTSSRHSKVVPGEVAAMRQSLLDRFGLTEDELPKKKAAKSAPSAADDDKLKAMGF